MKFCKLFSVFMNFPMGKIQVLLKILIMAYIINGKSEEKNRLKVCPQTRLGWEITNYEMTKKILLDPYALSTFSRFLYHNKSQTTQRMM